MKEPQQNPVQILHHFFEYQAAIHPDNIALVCDSDTLSYAELNMLANQLAHYLQTKNIGPGDLIGILMQRSIYVYISILAILKTGAAYVPMDPAFPPERIRFIAADCKLKALLTLQSMTTSLKEIECPLLAVDELQSSLPQYSGKNLSLNLSPTSLCYVIYTSGTTGKPKGVAITHAAICNFVQGAIEIYGVNANDRVYQGFSIAFDASIEEIWLAFGTGAILIVGVSEALHAGAGLNDFLNLHGVSIFSTIPTLLAILEPSIEKLRLLILGGENCPPELIQRWSRPGLRILNTYGPTETAVVATYYECDPNKPLLIGRPFPNYEVLILNEKLEKVPVAEVGEICIGGLGLSLGYVNRPELTAKKFVENSQAKGNKIYRTGDLGKQTQEGDIQFVGRMDEQIKLRGYRIELFEIEAVLMKNSALRNAVVSLQEVSPTVKALVAYLVFKNPADRNTDKILETLRTALPEYMIPTLFEVVEELPMLASGKVDRQNLPKPSMHQDQITKDYIAATTPLEKKITEVFENLFKHHPISIRANFFHDLGGHSLFAAQAVSELRKQEGLEYISMLDIYENPTAEQLAKKYAHIAKTAKETISIKQSLVSNLTYRLTTVGQLVGSYFVFAMRSWQLLLIILVLSIIWEKHSILSAQFFIAVAGFLVLLPPALFAIVIAAKWVLLGRIKPGIYPLWGWYYLRWWFVQRLQFVLSTELLIGSSLMNLYCRLMGAKIGKNCYIGTDTINAYDLLSIGDNASVGYNTFLSGYKVENNQLIIGKIEIGQRCFVGSKSILEVNTKLEDDAMLGDLSMLPANMTIPAGKYFQGSPAKPQSQPSNFSQKPMPLAQSTQLRNVGWGILHYLGLLYVTAVYYAAFVPAIAVIDYFYDRGEFLKSFIIAAPIGALLFFVTFCLGVLINKKILVGKIRPGSHKIKSFYYLRYWIVERLIASHLEVLADSLYYPLFLRSLGANIGKRVEMGEAPYCVPDLLTVEEEGFTASYVIIGPPSVRNGYIQFTPTIVGKRAFVGNDSLVPAGSILGDHSLIGCLSIPPTEGAKPDTSWFGSPAVYLPRREIFAGFSEEETYLPSKKLYVQRLVIESIRILLPTTFYLICLVAVFLAIDFLYEHFILLGTILLFPFFDFIILAAMTGVAIGLKWLLMGKMREAVRPTWSTFIWKYDIVLQLFEKFIVPSLIEPLLGTPWVVSCLRLLGTKIGRRVFVNTINFAEPDLIEIGNHVALNSDCVIQTHLYEDRVFKISHIKIGDNCTVGTASIILYNTIMEKNSSLGSLSLLMKGEILPHDTHWEGIPAQRAVKSPLNVTETIADNASDNPGASVQLGTD